MYQVFSLNSNKHFNIVDVGALCITYNDIFVRYQIIGDVRPIDHVDKQP